MPLVRVFTDRAVLAVDDDFHEIESFFDGQKLKKGFGYTKGDFVYVYRGKLKTKDMDDLLPGIYKNQYGEYKIVEPETDEDKEKYHVKNISELNIQSIFEEVEEHEEQFVDPRDVEIINSNSSYFSPKIKPDDDFLKRAIKMAILDKKINLKNYRQGIDNQYTLNNMKGGLEKDTKMTMGYYKKWEEILGLKTTIIVEDNGTDKISPLSKSITLSSEDF